MFWAPSHPSFDAADAEVVMATLGPVNPSRRISLLLLGGGDGGAAMVALKYPMIDVLQVGRWKGIAICARCFCSH